MSTRIRLEAILEERTKYLVRPKLLAAREARLAELKEFYAKFMERAIAELVPPFPGIPARSWNDILPPFDFALKLDSIRRLFLGANLDYGEPITQEVWDSNHEAVSRDVVQYQRAWRARLCSILEGTAKYPQSVTRLPWYASERAKARARDTYDDGFPKDLVKTDSARLLHLLPDEVTDDEDAANIARLHSPDAYFLNGTPTPERYPYILDRRGPGSYPWKEEGRTDMIRALVGAAKRLMTLLGDGDIFRPNTKMDEVTGMGQVFLCECCPALSSEPFGWPDLVRPTLPFIPVVIDS